tara:strand:- start:186 stop:476 length:291 start_codon:yes stop_codon:yes gene_type:complete
MTTPRRRSSKTQSVVPPTADMVEGCPPHHWLVVSGRQTCKKCDLEQAVPAMTDTRTTTWQRRTAEKADTIEELEQDSDAAEQEGKQNTSEEDEPIT